MGTSTAKKANLLRKSFCFSNFNFAMRTRRLRLLSVVEHATGIIDELSTNGQLRQLVRRVETSLVAATLVVRRQLVDAACGVLDSRQNIQTT